MCVCVLGVEQEDNMSFPKYFCCCFYLQLWAATLELRGDDCLLGAVSSRSTHVTTITLMVEVQEVHLEGPVLLLGSSKHTHTHSQWCVLLLQQ